MDAFWRGFSDRLQHCGRSGLLFFFTLLAIFSSLILSAILYHSDLWDHLPKSLPFLAAPVLLALLFWLLLVSRHHRAISRPSPETHPLSRDELRVARSKLMKNRK